MRYRSVCFSGGRGGLLFSGFPLVVLKLQCVSDDVRTRAAAEFSGVCYGAAVSELVVPLDWKV